jgi:uncharacterized protein (TIGR02001 family)
LLSVQGYAGYAARVSPAATIDVGVNHTHYTHHYRGESDASLTEVYAGVITPRFAARLYYSPDYFGSGRETLYGEINGSVSPGQGWRLSGHAGLLNVVSGAVGPGWRRHQYDWRIAVSKALGSVEAQLAWSGAGPDPDYYNGSFRGRSGVAASLSYLF